MLSLSRIKFVGFNALTFAVHQLCDPKLINYLLAKSISPAERDLIRGFVIFFLSNFIPAYRFVVDGIFTIYFVIEITAIS